MSLSAEELFTRLEAAGAAQSRPPVESWHPSRIGNINIVIDEAGQWWHEGSAFQRDSLVRLFAQILRREDDAFYLVTPAEKLRIEVADAPFVAVDLDIRGEPGATDLLFTTNVGDIVVADAEHPIFMRGGKPYCTVRAGLEAKLTTAVYYRLVDVACIERQSGREVYTVYSKGTGFPLDAS